jgi:N-acetylglutamate synthase-like GNAT family acetyltransferase
MLSPVGLRVSAGGAAPPGASARAAAEGGPRRRRAPETLLFTEREFYQREFRDRTLAIAVPEGVELAPLAAPLRELAVCNANAVLIAPLRTSLAPIDVAPVLRASSPRLEANVWRALRVQPWVGIAVARRMDFGDSVRELAVRLGVFKLVWLDAGGGIRNKSGQRLSFVHRAELRQLLANPARNLPQEARLVLLREIGDMLEAGISNVNVCAPEGLADELFTYAGSGTLFTRKRYMKVRPLGIDDFDAADDLIKRGVSEGFLLNRNEAAVDAVLAHGFGAFVEDRHLAGIGALLPGGDGVSGELASLYALTRFLGEGVGVSLVQWGVAEARRLGLAYVFACTTSERVGQFFQRQGFREVPQHQVPDRRWLGYDPERRMQVRCLRLDLQGRADASEPAHAANE